MSSASLRKYELFFVSFLVLIMPSLEAGKTLFWFLYLVTYLVRRYQDGNLSLVPREPVNLAITLYLLITLISTLVNWPFENGLKGFHDEFRFTTLFLCLYSAGYSAREYRQIALLIIVGVLGGLVYGLVEFLLQMRTDFQFHSAGIVTQSSIYLGIAILLNAGLLLDKNNTPGKLRTFLKLSLLIQIVALVYMGSRGSMLAIALTFILLTILTLNIRTVIAWLAGLSVIIVVFSAVIQIFPDSVFSKDIFTQYSIERIKESDSQRLAAWQIAIAKLSTGKDLAWGVGPRNYKVINEMEFVTGNDKFMQMKKYSHAHNLFLTQLIEQGIIGLLAMLYFFFLVLLKIIAIWRTDPDHSPGWAWYGGIGGFAIPIIAGLFNTPFYQEHAMLAMLVMGMMFAMEKAGHGNKR
jgi:O-antigen ligase